MGIPHSSLVVVLFVEYFQQLSLAFWNLAMFFSWAIIRLLQPEKKGLCGIRADNRESAALTFLRWLTALQLLVHKKTFQSMVTNKICSSCTYFFHQRNRLLLAEVFHSVLSLLFTVYASRYLFCTSSAECMCRTLWQWISFFKYTLVGKKWCLHKEVKFKVWLTYALLWLQGLEIQEEPLGYQGKTCKGNEIWKMCGIGNNWAEGSWQESKSCRWQVPGYFPRVDHKWSFVLGRQLDVYLDFLEWNETYLQE